MFQRERGGKRYILELEMEGDKEKCLREGEVRNKYSERGRERERKREKRVRERGKRER